MDSGPGDEMDTDSGDKMDRRPCNEMDRSPGDKMERCPGDDMDRGPGDETERCPGDDMDRGPGDERDIYIHVGLGRFRLSPDHGRETSGEISHLCTFLQGLLKATTSGPTILAAKLSHEYCFKSWRSTIKSCAIWSGEIGTNPTGTLW